MAGALDGTLVKLPNGIDDRVIVCVENVFPIFRVAGDMNLGDAIGRNAVHIIVRIKAVILRGNVNVIDVQQNAAIGPLDDLIEKFPLGHFRNVKFRVTADILDGDRNFQEIAPPGLFAR